MPTIFTSITSIMDYLTKFDSTHINSHFFLLDLATMKYQVRDRNRNPMFDMQSFNVPIDVVQSM